MSDRELLYKIIVPLLLVFVGLATTGLIVLEGVLEFLNFEN